MLLKNLSYLGSILFLIISINQKVYGSNFVLNEDQILTVTEQCNQTHQATLQCYLLAEDALSYSDQIDIDWNFDQIDSPYSDYIAYAYAINGLTLPVTLRLIPTITKMARNNSFALTIIALLAGAIIFKNIYDSTSPNTSVIKTMGMSGAEEKSKYNLSTLKKSTRFQYFLQKGPEYESKVVIPYFRDKDNRDRGYETLTNSKYSDPRNFSKFVNNALNPDNPLINNSPVVKKKNDAISIGSKGNSYQTKNSADLSREFLRHNTPIQLNPYLNYLAQIAAYHYLSQDKYSAMLLVYNIFTQRIKSYHSDILVKQEKQRRYFYNQNNYTYITTNQHEFIEIWNAFLLELISHLELTDRKNSPQFEEQVYLTFLSNEIKYIDNQIIDIDKYINYKKLESYTDSLDLPENLKNNINTLKDIFLKSQSPFENEQRLFPEIFYTNEISNLDTLKIYLSIRRELLTMLKSAVTTRLNVWKRVGEYKFLPEESKSREAYRDWKELLKLSSHLFFNLKN